MINECLNDSSMRLGVPFIAPRQLGAVGDIVGRQFLLSVGWRTGQSFKLEIDSLQIDNSEDSNSFLLISKARDF
jgi:hypothetical protein